MINLVGKRMIYFYLIYLFDFDVSINLLVFKLFII